MEREGRKKRSRDFSTSSSSSIERSKKKKKHKSKRLSSSSSNRSSSSSPSLSERRRKKKEKKKEKVKIKEKRSHSFSDDYTLDKKHKKKKKKKKKLKEKKKDKKDVKQSVLLSNKDDVSVTKTVSSQQKHQQSIQNQVPQRRPMVPMTKEEYDKQQSIIRRVYDPETGRNRLVKGDGEIMEEIVSKARHKEINRMSTKADGEFFAASIGIGKK